MKEKIMGTPYATMGYGYAVDDEVGFVYNAALDALLAEVGVVFGYHGSDDCRSPYLVIVESSMSTDWDESVEFDIVSLFCKWEKSAADWDKALAEALVRMATFRDACTNENTKEDLKQTIAYFRRARPRWFLCAHLGS